MTWKKQNYFLPRGVHITPAQRPNPVQSAMQRQRGPLHGVPQPSHPVVQAKMQAPRAPLPNLAAQRAQAARGFATTPPTHQYRAPIQAKMAAAPLMPLNNSMQLRAQAVNRSNNFSPSAQNQSSRFSVQAKMAPQRYQIPDRSVQRANAVMRNKNQTAQPRFQHSPIQPKLNSNTVQPALDPNVASTGMSTAWKAVTAVGALAATYFAYSNRETLARAGQYLPGGEKSAEGWDAVSDSRRVHMQNTSDRVKTLVGSNYDSASVSLGDISLLHDVDKTIGSKTYKRTVAMAEWFRAQKKLSGSGDITITPDAMGAAMKSSAPIQIGREHGTHNMMTLEGVGRVAAIRDAAIQEGIDLHKIKLPVQVADISHSSHQELMDVHHTYYEPGSEQKPVTGYVPTRTLGLARTIVGKSMNTAKLLTDAVGLTGKLPKIIPPHVQHEAQPVQQQVHHEQSASVGHPPHHDHQVHPKQQVQHHQQHQAQKSHHESHESK